jgi:hypothetical protein
VCQHDDVVSPAGSGFERQGFDARTLLKAFTLEQLSAALS